MFIKVLNFCKQSFLVLHKTLVNQFFKYAKACYTNLWTHLLEYLKILKPFE